MRGSRFGDKLRSSEEYDAGRGREILEIDTAERICADPPGLKPMEERMKVKEAMHKGVEWRTPDTPVSEIARQRKYIPYLLCRWLSLGYCYIYFKSKRI